MGAYFYSYLNTAQTILASYKFEQPFHVHLKTFFKRNKKYGSRDRKLISNLCFGFFRIGDAAVDLEFKDQIIIGYFLTHDFDNGCLAVFKPEWVDKILLSLNEKLNIVELAYPSFIQEQLFPDLNNLSDGISKADLSKHHFTQPDFYLRIRPGKTKMVLQKLQQHKITYKEISSTALRLASGIDLQGVLELDKEVVVQDISSQNTLNYFPSFSHSSVSIWDACAGSGGKSILACDAYAGNRLYVSDIREEILEELSRRFKYASVHPQSSFCTDLQHSLSKQVVDAHLTKDGVDLIIADVPCSGSGTWGRSPEWLKGFDITLIEAYQNRQKSIVSNLPGHLKSGGYLLYITCSVFRQENEDVVDYLLNMSSLKLKKKGVVHHEGGDYLFAALFQKQD